MIEAIDVGPGLHRMAGFATEGRAIRPLFRHAVVEFALMRVLMAPGAGLILKFERQDLIRAPGCAELVAIAAGYRGVGAGEREFRVAVLCNRVRRAVPVHDGVAVFAAVLVGSARKLVGGQAVAADLLALRRGGLAAVLPLSVLEVESVEVVG